ncbi:MAG: hypothetical protein ACRD0K_11565 [Egibacteraceae bacterium]
MRRGSRGIAAIPLVAAALLPACGAAVSDSHEIDEPVTVEHVEGTDVARLTLTQRAVERLGIQTAPVETDGDRTVVPSAAVFVEPDGTWWVYTSPEPLVFVRHRISVERDDGELAFLTEGPPPGTRVATVGVPELLGAEYELGH